MSNISHVLNAAALVFWDFDGVIKESVHVKTLAYEALFLPFGSEVASRVKCHHEDNGGMSRFDKIPLYLSWAGETITQEKIDEYCSRFSSLVFRAVVDSAWVPGVREYLSHNFVRQKFVLVTATPQNEIEQIVAALDIADCFQEIYGSPTKKIDAIGAVLSEFKIESKNALMIGDSETDLAAALANAVPFLLRRTSLNLSTQLSYSGPTCHHFRYE